MTSSMIYLGDRMGLFRALAAGGVATSQERRGQRPGDSEALSLVQDERPRFSGPAAEPPTYPMTV